MLATLTLVATSPSTIGTQVDLREFLRVLRKNWLILVIVTVLGGAGALSAAYATKATYRSTTQLYLTSSGANSSVQNEYRSGLTTAQRVASYVQLVSSPLVSQAVATELGQPDLAGAITGEIVGTQPAATYMITVTVTDHSAARAHAIADAVGKVFGSVVNLVESGQSGGGSPFAFTVVKPASFNPHAVSPNKKSDLALGLILGFVAAVLLAMLRHVLDRSVKSAATSERLGVPVLALIPADRRANRRPLVTATDDDPRAEAFRQLRTGLQFMTGDSGAGRVIVVTGPEKSEGKTTTAANLAVTMARAGASVALLEADLRRPRLEQLFGRAPSAGLTNVLLGRMKAKDVLAPVSDPDTGSRLSLMGAGPAVGNPSELLGSTAMSGVLAELAASHDFVLLDTPAVLAVTDAAVLAGMADGVLLVVRHGRTSEQAVMQSVRVLDQVEATLLGSVITAVPSGAEDDVRFGYPYKQSGGVVSEIPADLRPATSRQRVSAAADGKASTPPTATAPRVRSLRTRSRTGPDVS